MYLFQPFHNSGHSRHTNSIPDNAVMDHSTSPAMVAEIEPLVKVLGDSNIIILMMTYDNNNLRYTRCLDPHLCNIISMLFAICASYVSSDMKCYVYKKNGKWTATTITIQPWYVVLCKWNWGLNLHQLPVATSTMMIITKVNCVWKFSGIKNKRLSLYRCLMWVADQFLLATSCPCRLSFSLWIYLVYLRLLLS